MPKVKLFSMEKKSRNARFLAVIPCDASSCLRWWHGLAGAEVKAEQGKADPVGYRAYWGKGEGVSRADETLRLCLKESR